MFTRILVPIDGSNTAFTAAEFAIKFAEEQNASITLLYVINDRSLEKLSGVAEKSREELISQFRKQGKQFFHAAEKIAQNLGFNIKFDEVTLVGDPGEEIINYVSRNSHDLIIMPVKDPEHSSKFSLGHVTARVIQSGGVPVLSIPFTGQPEERQIF